MRIVHERTMKLARGWQTLLRVENSDGSIEGLVVRHDARTGKAISNSMEVIEAALGRETVIDSKETIDKATADTIENTLLEWLSSAKSCQFRYLQWAGDVMIGFTTKSDRDEYVETRPEGYEAPHVPRKKRIMLG